MTFHRILPKGEKYFIPPMSLAVDTFADLLRALASRYQVLHLSDAVRKIRKNELKGKIVCLTFDDGYLDNLEHAADVLLKTGLPATFFVPVHHIQTQQVYWWDYLDYLARESGQDFLAWTQDNDPDWINDVSGLNKVTGEPLTGSPARDLVRRLNSISRQNREEYLSKLALFFGPYQGPRLLMDISELKRLIDLGFEIGSHTVSHNPLTDLTLGQAESEISQSRQVLEQMCEARIQAFCYPRGAWNNELAGLAEKSGYSCAVTTCFGSNRPGQNMYSLKRRNISDYHGIRSLFPVLMSLMELSGRMDFLLSSRR
ncbi:polysaccharide deacetylase family protein [Desulfonatronovibrio hydrogenovorans]|uniref:polysaccharide deacetylase family protein n=1 Tax=Desulfonatronovibrio hydrogenovorans TaxID=53245 RepID=UPI00137811CC|nr:polysaccharide deacetylase family protein [Desulfonatronovibrio hydrogenovorans]